LGFRGVERAFGLAQGGEFAPSVRVAQIGHAALVCGSEGKLVHQPGGGLAEGLGAEFVGGVGPQRGRRPAVAAAACTSKPTTSAASRYGRGGWISPAGRGR